jgi:hypothetical protein
MMSQVHRSVIFALGALLFACGSESVSDQATPATIAPPEPPAVEVDIAPEATTEPTETPATAPAEAPAPAPTGAGYPQSAQLDEEGNVIPGTETPPPPDYGQERAPETPEGQEADPVASPK